MEESNLRPLVDALISAQWKMFLAGTVVNLMLFSVCGTLFYVKTTSDLELVLRKLDIPANHNTSTVTIAPPRDIQDNVREILQQQGHIK